MHTLKKFIIYIAIFSFSFSTTPLYAIPNLNTVIHGNVTFDNNNSNFNINQSSNKAIINWNSFNIGENETVNFNQLNSNSIALNRIFDSNPSNILGNLNANGKVMLINSNGIMFGANSKIDVSGLIATTANITNENFLNENYVFNIAGNNTAEIINNGNITIKESGLAALVAPNVKNNGIITAKLGKVELGAGETFTLDFYGDGLINLQASEEFNKKLEIANNGNIKANGGSVIMKTADAANATQNIINMSGVIEANTIENKNGEIILKSSGDANIEGDIKSSGGFVETSAKENINIAGANIDTSSTTGNNGLWLIDPINFEIGTGATSTNYWNVSDLSLALTNNNINIEAIEDIYLSTDFNSANANGNSLTLTAGRYIKSITGNYTFNINNGSLKMYLNQNGTADSNNTTIQDAVDVIGNIENGTHLYVGDGIYNESITIDKSNLSLTGNIGNTDTPGSGNTVIINGASLVDTSGFIIEEGVRNVLIEGFDIQNFYGSTASGIKAWNRETYDITIQHNDFSDLDWNAVLVGNGGDGNGGEGSHLNWNISYNTVNNANGYGIELTNTKNSVINNNIISNIGFSGVLITGQVQGTSQNYNAQTDNITISNNTINDIGGDIGIYLVAFSNSTNTGNTANISNINITGNNINDVTTGTGIYAWSMDNALGDGELSDFNITDNSINIANPGAAGSAVTLSDVMGNSTFSSNEINYFGTESGNYFHALNLSGSETGNWDIEYNTFSGNDIAGENSAGIRIQDNIGENSEINVYANDISGFANGIRTSSPAFTKIEANNIHNNEKNGIRYSISGDINSEIINNFINNNGSNIKFDSTITGGFVNIFDNDLSNPINYALTNESSLSITAENNWWGYADVKNIDALIEGNVNYESPINLSIDLYPNTPGFQGNVNNLLLGIINSSMYEEIKYKANTPIINLSGSFPIDYYISPEAGGKNKKYGSLGEKGTVSTLMLAALQYFLLTGEEEEEEKAIINLTANNKF